MSEQTFTVKGMTCDHCVRSVTDEVASVPGVTGVDVDLASGLLTVRADSPVDDDNIRVAVDEAGYELSS